MLATCVAVDPNCVSQVRTASCAGTACLNSFGDEQLAVDMVADKLLFEALRYSVSVLVVEKGPGPACKQIQTLCLAPPCAHTSFLGVCLTLLPGLLS